MSLSKPSPVEIVAVTTDQWFAISASGSLSPTGTFAVTVLSHGELGARAASDTWNPAAVLIDLDDQRDERFLRQVADSLQGRVPVIGVTSAFDHDIARCLLQLRASDFVLKSSPSSDLVNACVRAIDQKETRSAHAKVFTLLPAAGGVGVTTLAIQTALILLGLRQRGEASVCLVDLNFQQGACADYLDLEPRLDLDEIEPRPERLDSQLLEVMLSHHSSGLKLIGAPHRPTEMRSFDPQVVIRLLELVSSRFDYIVLDLPRTWFSWTDNILLGSDHAFIIAEATVPGLRNAAGLCAAIKERLGERAAPKVVVNRFEQRMFAAGVRRTDLAQALGGALAGTVPNDYGLVREAIDRGVSIDEINPRNKVTVELRRLIVDGAMASARSRSSAQRDNGGLASAVSGLLGPLRPAFMRK